MDNFTVIDTLGCSLGFLIFGLFAIVPGYVIGWLADLLAFRKSPLITRLTLAVPLSIALSPILAYLSARALSFTATWIVFGFLWLLFAVIFISEAKSRRGTNMPDRHSRIYMGMALGWLLLGIFSLVDIQWKDRLYYSVVSYDYTLRVPMVSSIWHTGIPPVNYRFSPGRTFPLRYHYFWMIPCSLVKQIGGPLLSARNALIAGTLWVGLGVMASVMLFLRFVAPAGQHRIHRRILIGIGLLLVTGLDLLPNLFFDLAGRPFPDPEWWNQNQVTGWITSVLFVPHHTASLIAGLAGVLIIWHAAAEGNSGRRLASSLVAALCLAGCAGLSIYVALVVGAWLAVWTIIVLLKGWRKEAIFLAGTGCMAALAITPYLADLSGQGAPGTPGASMSPFAFAIRGFSLASLLLAGDRSVWHANLLNALFLPLNYFLELGFFLIVGIWTVRHYLRAKRPLGRYQLAMLSLAGTSVLMCTFLRSSVISANDFGMRGFLPTQFVLLLWAVDLLDRRWAVRSFDARSAMRVLLVLGVIGTVHEVISLRAFPVLSDLNYSGKYAWLALDQQAGRRTYALRKMYQQLDSKLPASAIVQNNPGTGHDEIPFGLYANRPAGAEGGDCGAVFGGDPRLCAAILSSLRPVFDGSLPPGEVDRTCRQWSISTLIVKDTDPAWDNRNSWVWQRTPQVANSFVRAFLCGGSSGRRM